MPGKPPPGGSVRGWPPLRAVLVWARDLYSRLVYPHAVYFCKKPDEFGEWYLERYEWMAVNIRNPHRNVWLASHWLTVCDQHTMQEVWVQGCLRFRRAEDAVLFRMRWS